MMTRQEFLDEINDWDALIDFCSYLGCDLLDDVYNQDQMDDYIEQKVCEDASNMSWIELRDTLNYIPTNPYGAYFVNTGCWDEWSELTDEDFEDYKQDVLEWMDDGEYWDEDESDNTEDEDISGSEDENTEPDDLIPIDSEDISISELILACNNDIKVKSRDLAAEKDEGREVIDDFLSEFYTVTKA